MSRSSRHFLLSCLTASALGLYVDTAASADPPVPAQQLPALISQLGSEKYATRNRAQAALQELASTDRELVLGGALDAYLKTVDPEVRVRLRSAMFDIVANDLRREGFLGIRMMDAPMRALRGREIVQQHTVQILTVITGTAAAEAGLRPGDRITELDGTPFDGKMPAHMVLSDYIRSKSSGAPVKLAIRRGTDDLTIDLQLGERPESLDEGRRARAFEEWLDKMLNRDQAATGKRELDAPPDRSVPHPVPIPRQRLAPLPAPKIEP